MKAGQLLLCILWVYAGLGYGGSWSYTDTLLASSHGLMGVTYQPMPGADYVLAVAECDSSERIWCPGSYTRISVSVRHEGNLSVYRFRPPDPRFQYIWAAYPLRQPTSAISPVDGTAHVFFLSKDSTTFSVKGGSIYEVVVREGRAEGPYEVASATSPAPINFFGPVRIVGFGAHASEQLILYWFRDDGVCFRRYTTHWSEPSFAIENTTNLGGGVATVADLFTLGGSLYACFRGYRTEDIVPNVSPTGFYNALYWARCRVSRCDSTRRPRWCCDVKLLWRTADMMAAGKPWMLYDEVNSVFHVLCPVADVNEVLSKGVIYIALLPDGTVIVRPRFIVQFPDPYAYFAEPVYTRDGQIHIVYYRVGLQNCGAGGGIWYVHGSGAKWSAPYKLAGTTIRPGDTTTVGYPHLSLDQEDTLHVVWQAVSYRMTDTVAYIFHRERYAFSTGSPVETLRHNASPAPFLFRPVSVPVSNDFSFYLQAPFSGTLTFELFNILGQRVLSQTLRAREGDQIVHLANASQVLGRCGAGTYVYRVTLRGSCRRVQCSAAGKIVYVR